MHRGTGITSGLMPVRMHEGGDLPPDHKHTYTPDMSDAEVMKILEAGSLESSGGKIYKTEVPSIGDIYEEKLRTTKGIFGEPAEPTPTGQLLLPWMMNLSASLMSGKSYQGGLGGAMEIMGNAMKESTPALTEGLALKKAEERANRSEQIDAAKIAYQSAETERQNLLDQNASLASTKLKLDAPEIGDTLFLVERDKPHVPGNIIMAYQKEETIEGRRVSNLYDFDGIKLTEEYVKYSGKAKPKDFPGVNVRFTVPGEEGEEDIETERMAIGRFDFDPTKGEWGVKYYFTDDAGDEHELPGNAVIIAREGDASEVGQNMNKKEENKLLEQQIAGTKFIMKAIDAWTVINKQPETATDIGSLAIFADRIVADAKALVAAVGGTYEVDHNAMENYMDEDLGIASAKLRSIYLDLAISRAVFVEGGTRVTDQDVINQLRILGARGIGPEAALVLLQDFVDMVSREYNLEHNLRSEKNTLINPVPDNYLLRNLILPWLTGTGAGTGVGQGSKTTGVDDDLSPDEIELLKKYLKELEEK